MKNLLRILGGLLLLLAVVFFLYGSMKTASGVEQGMEEVELEDGIVMVEENNDQTFARYGFNTALALGIGGVLCLFAARTVGKR